jgi:hypothetical protein
MEDKFYCPKTYLYCDRPMELKEMKGPDGIIWLVPNCHTDTRKCKFEIHKRMIKALENCADAS